MRNKLHNNPRHPPLIAYRNMTGLDSPVTVVGGSITIRVKTGGWIDTGSRISTTGTDLDDISHIYAEDMLDATGAPVSIPENSSLSNGWKITITTVPYDQIFSAAHVGTILLESVGKKVKITSSEKFENALPHTKKGAGKRFSDSRCKGAGHCDAHMATVTIDGVDVTGGTNYKKLDLKCDGGECRIYIGPVERYP